MNKPYLLIAGDYYYPQERTSDWIGCFSTYEEAYERVESVVKHYHHIGSEISYKVKGGEYGIRQCDWFEIVDLREWTQ
jgi:hypothetical protein